METAGGPGPPPAAAPADQQPPADTTTATTSIATAAASPFPKLARLPPDERSAAHHVFVRPVKRIHDGADVAAFLASQAYRDLGVFLLQLNHAVLPREGAPPFTLDGPREDPPAVRRLQQVLAQAVALIDEAPPDPGPRRFGNTSFRVWHRLLAERADALLAVLWADGPVDATATDGATDGATAPATAADEVREYFLGSFGSSQRLDYGTGHELSFLAFLGSLWKLGVFGDANADADAGPDADPDEAVERSIVLGVVEPYLQAVRRLILTYTLEPAGSHGVWGLDDHAFLPYIFGSAQLAAPVGPRAGWATPQAGSAPRAPRPGDVLRPAAVAAQRGRNMYFAAVAFIGDVKRGPFWEHSPILYDVSGIRDGWAKINKGMLKMYHAEVLAKFPVVQHFPFGSLFAWDRDPLAAAAPAAASVHLASQPAGSSSGGPTGMPPPMPGGSTGIPYSRVPAAARAHPAASGDGRGTTAAQTSITRAPWAK